MCFKNLPIEVDAQGNASLRPGVAHPYSPAHPPRRITVDGNRERLRELIERDDARRVDVDRVTRVAGEPVIDLHALLDLVEGGCRPDLAVRIAAPLEWSHGTSETLRRLAEVGAELLSSDEREQRIARELARRLRPS
jgi:hypothetical protein